MWIGLFSDIHANREALSACLEHARRAGIERLLFLGDYVGYGADPGFAVDTVMAEVERGAIALTGNHDAAIAAGSGGMNAVAAAAIDWTRGQLDATQRDFLAALPLTHEDGDHLYVHASAKEPAAWHYVSDLYAASESFTATRARVTVCGHTHQPHLFHVSTMAKFASFNPVSGVEIPLLPNRRWLAVIGAVGQPRDANPAACYAALDTERGAFTYVRVPYDTETAARKVRAAGLPAVLADRLIYGE